MNEKSLAASQFSDDSRELLKSRLKHLVREKMGVTGGWHPLSQGQEALWFLWKLAPRSWAYSMVLPMMVRGPIDTAAFRRSLQILSDRHPGLRTEFKDDAGQIQQRGKPDLPVNLVETDASTWSEEQLLEKAREEAQRPFDLAENAALRVALFRRAANEHLLLVMLPHIVGDLWSLVILLDELRLVYAGEVEGQPVSLPPQPLSYEEYVRAQRSAETAADAYASDLAYWRETLAGELPVLDLPADRQRPATQSFTGGTVFRELDAALTRDLERLAMKEETTLFTVLLTAYQVLLHRYSGQDAVMVGMPTAGRQQAGLADVIGDFINMLPIRASFAEERSFRQCLADTRKSVLDALKHQDCPFSAIVDAIEPPRDVSRTPIFQTTFVLQKFQRYPELQSLLLPGPGDLPAPFADLMLEPWPMAQQDGQFDVNLEMKKSGSGALMAAWKFAADLFDPATIDRIASSFETLLRQMVADPDARVSALSLLREDEVAAVLEAGRGAIVAPPAESTVCALFEARAATHGDAVAIRCGDDSLTYAALQLRVEEIARGLAARGVGRETLVAVIMQRGLDFVTALLAVMKAGGGFLPLDPRNPPARSRTVLESSGLTMVLTETAFATDLEASLAESPTDRRPPVVTFEALAEDASTHPLPPAAAGGDLAYTMYTSGSTGQPKGVMVEHRGMVNHVLGKLADLDFGPSDVLAQNAPQSFDVVVWQSLAPLVSGGQVVVIPDAIAEDPAALIGEISRRGVTMLQIVPSMFRAILEEAEACDDGPPDLTPLRWMIPTGEALPTELCRRWFALYPAISILNTYGSTECSDDQCHYRLDRIEPADAAMPIVSVGRPIANMTAHVLDAKLAPVPAGVVGELYIGGIGVGRGYRGDPERTAAAFIPDPYGSTPDARLYRTRDMARRRADGLIDFLGRTDHMIKLHGLRIEPGEIETALCRHPDIAEAAVLARTGPAGDRRLVAYVVATEGGSAALSDVEILRPFLAATLPFSMIPATFVLLPALPLTVNGKLDQKRLPTPDWTGSVAGPVIAPRNGIEATIAAIWGHLLKRDTIGVTEDFFASGGDSIRSIQVAARCRQAGLPIEPVDLFVHRTIAALAEYLGDRFSDGSWAAPSPVDTAVAEILVAPENLERALAMVSFDFDEPDA
jgi:amino acid adenylation domain-containing protein